MNDRVLRVLEFDKIVNKVVDLAASELGKEMAAAMLPQTGFAKIQALLKETSDGAAFVARRGSPPLGGIHDIRDGLKRADMGSALSPTELLRVADVLGACRNLKNYASEDKIAVEDGNVVSDLIGTLETNKRLEDKIRFAILSEDEIADDASPELNRIRRHIRDLQNSIKDKLNEIIKSSRYQKYMQELIVTMRGDRYVIPVKQEYRNEVQGLVHDMSASGATLFIEPMAVVEANNNIRQLKIKEQLEVERILHELSAGVAEISPSLRASVSTLARLDFIFAKAKFSLDYSCICPRLNSEKRIVIKKGRHPLLDQKTVVPIDLWIGESFSTLVITGPNTGGKTVTLKTVGLFTLMAQAGLHLPANEGTEVSVFEKVFADIGDEQSIEQSLSTFSSHMKNIVNILDNVNQSSLLLFDELGAGTDPTEGAALAMAILEKLRETGSVTIATTHYSELKMYAISNTGVENACCEFDVETLRPTYKLLIGVPGKSNAFAISQRLGLKQPVIDKAKEFLTQEDIKFEDLLMSIEKNREETERERINALNLRKEIEKLKIELEEQKSSINRQKEKLIKEAREDARRVYLDAKEEAEAMLEEIRRLEKERETMDRNRAAEEIRVKLKQRVNRIEESMVESLLQKDTLIKPPENLKPGDSVLIVNLNRQGTILTTPDKDGEALVQAGIMKINVHISNLKFIDEQKAGIEKTGLSRMGGMKARNISTEIDIRGMTLNEAEECVDKYLDDASIAGLKEVVVIHGKGTGALRSGIHQFLKSSSHVSTFRQGAYGEGDAGVTVVQLK